MKHISSYYHFCSYAHTALEKEVMRLDITRIRCLIGDVGNRDTDSLKGITASFDYEIWETHRGAIVSFFFNPPTPPLTTVQFYSLRQIINSFIPLFKLVESEPSWHLNHQPLKYRSLSWSGVSSLSVSADWRHMMRSRLEICITWFLFMAYCCGAINIPCILQLWIIKSSYFKAESAER